MGTKETKQISFRILILGDYLVGKTTVMESYIEGKFIETFVNTFIFDFKMKSIKMEDGKTIKIQIWDTSPLQRVQPLINSYLKGAHGIMLIYDVTNKKSFDYIKGRMETLRKEISKPIPIYLVGNKIDMEKERIITKEQGKEFAKNNGLLFFECTPKKIETVNLIFKSLIKNIYENFLNFPEEEKRKNMHK